METSLIRLCILSIFFQMLFAQPSLGDDSQGSPRIAVMLSDLTARGVSTADCGIHALYSAAVMVGRAPAVGDLFGDLSDPVEGRGLSLEQLMAIARRNGLQVSALSGLSARDIDWATCPIIIPLQVNSRSGLNHWATVCGIENDKVLIFDSVDLHSQRSRAEINSVWHGDAIIVGATDGVVRTCKARLVVGSMVRKGAIVSFACLVAIIGRWFASKQSRPFASISFIVIGWLAMVSYLATDSFQPATLLRVFELERCVNLSDVNFLEVTYTRRIPKDSNTIVVDCRDRYAFSLGHIPNSYNLPINASKLAWESFASKVDRQLVVVYCQSAQCEWAEICQQRLRCLGKNATVLSGGYERFQNNANSDEL